ncbi:TonB-dependent receptor plug domain-containing protein [Mangrovivirga sp. M17]|uniref:TonB-dependent receptor plug domain-containing protein n=1 Tax=Mangrovivirga halotolerans TaxID=2993936 RepID=A0ABT3RQD1_9BACT|nr:TonB-dependent receptor plug domain-containing protein [Mangrovivirga halotolerans]MCX2743548.1 TonB-dependent receptor plug domain-containing protein [Mangrovivirga halotolerans]
MWKSLIRVNFLLLISFFSISAQDTDDGEKDLFEMSLEELMEVEIYSASKKSESSFDAPLSSTVITGDEIIASGATTIEEALRLVPGLVVREETNGNFDVHVRGNESLPPGNFTFYTENSLTLVMIDGRRVYNYINGGTFWEALPIGLADVERIEVVRGPSSPLYGPNAVSGVINIITKQAFSNSESSVTANVQGGNKGTVIGSFNALKRLKNNKVSIGLSGNIETRDRDDDQYYNWWTGEYTSREELISYTYGNQIESNSSWFSEVEMAKERLGVNAFIAYDINEDVNIDLKAGYQNSVSQSAFFENFYSVLGDRTSESYYIDLTSKVKGLNIQASTESGIQDIARGSGFVATFDYNKTDLNIDYAFDFKNLSLQPAFNYQQATYSDLPYVEQNNTYGLMNAEQQLSNYGFSLKADYKLLNDKLRLVAAGRFDKYNVPDDVYFTYQFISTYKFNEKHLIRAVASRSNRSAFFIDSYANYYVEGDIDVAYIGNEELHLPTMNLLEFGYRGKLSDKILLDIEVFRTVFDNTVDFQPTEFYNTAQGPVLEYHYFNSDLISTQNGITTALSFAPSNKIQMKVFGTVQKTELENYDKKESGINPFTLSLPSYTRIDQENKRTPNFYGGMTFNYRPVEKLSIYSSLYYMSEQVYRHERASTSEELGTTNISPVTTLSIKASYEFFKGFNGFVNARNLLAGEKDQFGFADRIGALYMAGINVNL